MTFTMRQERRDKVDRPAWISVGDNQPLRKCIVVDISDSGAKLTVDSVDDLPEIFSLWLSRHGHLRYGCRIVWSGQNKIGVQFSSGQEQPA